MLADWLISTDILPLKTSDTGDEALNTMDDFYVRHLPIVNDKQLLGLISNEDILENDASEDIGSYVLNLPLIYLRSGDHVYEVMRLMTEYQLTTAPVVDEETNYLGLITQESVLKYFAQSISLHEPGSILVIELGKRDYSLSEIARIVESENAIILSSFITSAPESAKLEVSLKINRQDIRAIVATFERFEYIVRASFNETEYYDALRERYDALISYLNV